MSNICVDFCWFTEVRAKSPRVLIYFALSLSLLNLGEKCGYFLVWFLWLMTQIILICMSPEFYFSPSLEDQVIS